MNPELVNSGRATSEPDDKPAHRRTFGAIRTLPLLTLHLTDRCNSKCISCDYWRHGRNDITVESVTSLLPELQALGTHTVLLSGGEPLIHPQWGPIARLLRSKGMSLWLVTSGLSLFKHAKTVAELFDNVTVSLDGIDRAMYQRIRGVDAFDNVCEGIRAVAALGCNIGIRVTVQHENFFAMSAFVNRARELGARQVSFLAADVSNSNAFGRVGEFNREIALGLEDLPLFAVALKRIEEDHAADFRSGLIAESPRKLRRLLEYYAAICGQGAFPEVRCNAPEFSAVIETNGAIKPCFFITGPKHANTSHGLAASLNSTDMTVLRNSIRERQRAECVTCVCSLWRESDEQLPTLSEARITEECAVHIAQGSL